MNLSDNFTLAELTKSQTAVRKNISNKPSTDHINNLINGKIGALAKELAEETTKDLNLDAENITDVNDIFNNGNSQRQFFTVSGKDVPNDRDTFMKWCYQTPPTCKEGNGLQCAANQAGEHRGLGSGPPPP